MTAKTQFPVFNGYAPAEGGPKAIPIALDFSTVGEIDFDLIDETSRGVIDFVQSVWVDNSANANALKLSFSQTGQVLVVPAFAQGIWPVIAPSGLRCAASTTAAGGLKPLLIFLNVPMPMTQFGPLAVTISNVTATFAPTTGSFVDHSGSITLGGTSQVLLAANANAKRRVVQNPTSATESIFINFGAAAAIGVTSIELTPGQTFDTGTGPIDTQAWNIVAATTGHTYSCKEM